MPALRVGKYLRPRWLRRHLVQIAALSVTLVVVGVLAVLAFRPSAGRGGLVHSPVVARATATADPRVGEVKAVARAYLLAFWESAKTGDTSAVDALTEKDSQAYGNAADVARISKESHHTFATIHLEVDESAWQVDLASTLATVHLAYRLYGHDADWPSLRPSGPDRLTQSYSVAFQMELVGTRWAIYESS